MGFSCRFYNGASLNKEFRADARIVLSLGFPSLYFSVSLSLVEHYASGWAGRASGRTDTLWNINEPPRDVTRLALPGRAHVLCKLRFRLRSWCRCAPRRAGLAVCKLLYAYVLVGGTGYRLYRVAVLIFSRESWNLMRTFWKLFVGIFFFFLSKYVDELYFYGDWCIFDRFDGEYIFGSTLFL